MDDRTALEEVVKHLKSTDSQSATPPAAAITQLANSRTGIAQLAALSTTLAGEPSTLEAETARRLTCAECQEQLDVYIESAVTSANPREHWPLVARHLQSCARCHHQYNLLLNVARVEMSGTLGPPPAFANFAEWRSMQHHTSPDGTLWRNVSETVAQLVYTVGLLLHKATAVFDQLALPLQPRLATVANARQRAFGQPTGPPIQALELPHQAGNLFLTLSVGPTIADMGTLVIKIERLTPHQPIALARVLLRDPSGTLLESNLSDPDGLTYLRKLAPGHYTLTIEQPGQPHSVVIPFYLAAESSASLSS